MAEFTGIISILEQEVLFFYQFTKIKKLILKTYAESTGESTEFNFNSKTFRFAPMSDQDIFGNVNVYYQSSKNSYLNMISSTFQIGKNYRKWAMPAEISRKKHSIIITSKNDINIQPSNSDAKFYTLESFTIRIHPQSVQTKFSVIYVIFFFIILFYIIFRRSWLD